MNGNCNNESIDSLATFSISNGNHASGNDRPSQRCSKEVYTLTQNGDAENITIPSRALVPFPDLVNAIRLHGRINELRNKFSLQILEQSSEINWGKLQAFRSYFEEKLLRANQERLFAGSFKVLIQQLSVVWIMTIDPKSCLFLAHIGHEGVYFVALFDEPCQDARCICWRWI